MTDVLVRDAIAAQLLADDGARAAFVEAVERGVRAEVGKTHFYFDATRDGARLAAAVETGQGWRPIRSAALTVQDDVAEALRTPGACQRAFAEVVQAAVASGVAAYGSASGSSPRSSSSSGGASGRETWKDFYAKPTQA